MIELSHAQIATAPYEGPLPTLDLDPALRIEPVGDKALNHRLLRSGLERGAAGSTGDTSGAPNVKLDDPALVEPIPSRRARGPGEGLLLTRRRSSSD